MKIIKTVKEFILEINNKKHIIIYGAGMIGEYIYTFLKNNGIEITAFAVTTQNKNWKLENIPVYCLSDVLNKYSVSDINLILAVTKKIKILWKKN